MFPSREEIGTDYPPPKRFDIESLIEAPERFLLRPLFFELNSCIRETFGLWPVRLFITTENLSEDWRAFLVSSISLKLYFKNI